MAADTPKIVLTPQERSHYFNRRECVVNEPLKVGRSVDRRRISPNNLIFDCRVLSRNHALIWFENGKFFIKDTKSSNGTFVNENRLSPSGEESGPVELKSRDVVQFGVNVNVDKKVTHGCIIATVKLYINEVEVPGHEPPVQQVMQIIQSALAKEQELETKLASMQSVLGIARELATDSMIAIVKEDELMSRLEMLENQLQVYSRNASDDELKKQLARAFEEKHKNELASKDSLRGVLQEKLECVSKLSQLQRDYDRAEQDCQRYKTMLDEAKDEHSQEVSKLAEKLKTLEGERKEIETKLNEEKENLTSELESLQADSDFTKSQLDKAKSQLNETQSELLEVRLALETIRQREAKGIPISTTEVPPGTEDPPDTGDSVNLQRSLVPPGTEEDPAGEPTDITAPKTTSEPFERKEALALGSVPEIHITQEQEDPVKVSPTHQDRQQIINHYETKILSLEEECKTSQERVRMLEEQLTEYSSGGGDMMVLAKKLSDSAITKGQLEVLQRSLVEAENLIVELKAQNQKASSADLASPDSRGIHDTSHHGSNASDLEAIAITKLKEEVHSLKESNHILESRLQRSEAESKNFREEKSSLEIELSVVSARFTSQTQDNSNLRSNNENLTTRNEDMQRRIDELCVMLKKQGEPSGLKKHVKILTFIALVSIGVALASWLL